MDLIWVAILGLSVVIWAVSSAVSRNNQEIAELKRRRFYTAAHADKVHALEVEYARIMTDPEIPAFDKGAATNEAYTRRRQMDAALNFVLANPQLARGWYAANTQVGLHGSWDDFKPAAR